MFTWLPWHFPKPGGGFKYFLFSTLFGEDSHFDDHIFQMGWFNHQLENDLRDRRFLWNDLDDPWWLDEMMGTDGSTDPVVRVKGQEVAHSGFAVGGGYLGGSSSVS